MKRSESEWSDLVYSDGFPYKDFASLLAYSSGGSISRRTPGATLGTWLASLSEKRQKEAYRQIKACCSRRRSR